MSIYKWRSKTVTPEVVDDPVKFEEAIQFKDPSVTTSVLDDLLEKFRPVDPKCHCGATMRLEENYLYRSSGGRAWACDGCNLRIGEALYLLMRDEWPS